MAKRELCYKEDVKKNHEKWIGYLDEDMIARLNIAVDKYIPTFTEQDIVKPYLENARAQMRQILDGVNIALDTLIENDPLIPKMEGDKTTLLECIEIIDSLLNVLKVKDITAKELNEIAKAFIAGLVEGLGDTDGKNRRK